MRVLAGLTLTVEAEEMRRMIRISHNKLDEELSELKEAFLIDLAVGGVNRIPEGDALAKTCLRMYLRWQENYNGEAERYRTAYEGLKIAMSLAEEYRGGAA